MSVLKALGKTLKHLHADSININTLSSPHLSVRRSSNDAPPSFLDGKEYFNQDETQSWFLVHIFGKLNFYFSVVS